MTVSLRGEWHATRPTDSDGPAPWRTEALSSLRGRPAYSGWADLIDRCSHCGPVYERDPGDTWFFTIIGDRLPVAAAVVVVYFNLGSLSRALAMVVFVAMIVAIIWTAPNRWGVGIALHYVSRVFFSGSGGSDPPSLMAVSGL